MTKTSTTAAADETMVGMTTRPITFSNGACASMPRTYPAGTTVYARARRSGGLNIRIPGTLYTQHVTLAAVAPC